MDSSSSTSTGPGPGSGTGTVAETTVSREVGGITLFEDEEVLHDFHPRWSKYWKSLTLCAILSFVGIGLVLFYFPWRARKRTRYVITSDRIIIQQGSWRGSQTDEYQFDRIRQIHTGQSLGEKLLGHGNIHVVFRGGAEVTFSGIANYDAVSNTIRHQQHGKR